MSPLNPDTIVSLLGDKLKAGDVVAFVGAGVSRTYHDDSRGSEFPGLPSASEMVSVLAQQKHYIDPKMSFPKAMFMIKKYERRPELERCLVEQLSIPTLQPLPAHDLLAQMPFSAFITTNYDCLLEKALETQRKRYISFVEDADVSRWRVSHLPILKIHGCLTRPKTLVAAEDEYRNLFQSKPIIAALLTALLANKTVLFLGFSLEDEDFRILHREIKELLGDHLPKSYAVVYKTSEYENEYWGDQGIELVESDLTTFLRKVFGNVLRNPTVGYSSPEDDDWLNTIFLEKLHNIRNKPSETQVIDAFLSHMLIEYQSPTLSCLDVTTLARNAADKIIEKKPNLHAFKRIWNDLFQKLSMLNNDDDSKAKAETIINAIIEQRRQKLIALGNEGRKIVGPKSKILLFSQSIQMLEVLKAVPRNIQPYCKLYVCECRPKSPSPFQDGAAICEYLKDTDYDITLVPDVSFGNLMARNQIDFAMMGAHSVFFDKNRNFKSFVNTCGSSLLLLAAEHYNKPVYIVAEDSKITILADGESEDVSYEEEENIFRNCDVLTNLRANGLRNVSEKNIGYDLCFTNAVTKLITLP